MPPNPLELLSSKRFEDVITKLKEAFDIVVIDSAPLQLVSDALVLSQHASSVIYVVKADATPYQVAQNGLKRLRRVNAPILGVVLNQLDLEKAEKYYGEYSGYRSYKGYKKYGYGKTYGPSGLTMGIAAPRSLVVPACAALVWLALVAVGAGRLPSRRLHECAAHDGVLVSARNVQPPLAEWLAVRNELQRRRGRVAGRSRGPGDCWASACSQRAGTHGVRRARARASSSRRWSCARPRRMPGRASPQSRYAHGQDRMRSSRPRCVNAIALGPSEAEVQVTVADLRPRRLGRSDRPQRGAAVERAVAAGMRRNPVAMLQISERRGRLDAACRHARRQHAHNRHEVGPTLRKQGGTS